MLLKDRHYDILKWIALVLLPAIATLIGAIGGYVNWQHTDLVVYCLVAFNTFLGTILGISTINYNKDTIEITTDEKIQR